MAWVSYNTVTGALVQISDYEIPVTDGLSVTVYPLPKIALQTEYAWDANARDFTLGSPRVLSRLAFLRRFTAPERIAIRQAALTDPIIDDAMRLLDMAELVSLDDADAQNMVGYFAQKALIQPPRVAEILA